MLKAVSKFMALLQYCYVSYTFCKINLLRNHTELAIIFKALPEKLFRSGLLSHLK